MDNHFVVPITSECPRKRSRLMSFTDEKKFKETVKEKKQSKVNEAAKEMQKEKETSSVNHKNLNFFNSYCLEITK